MELLSIGFGIIGVLCGVCSVIGVSSGKIGIETKNSKYDRFAVCLVYAAVTLAIVTELIESITVVIK